MIHFKQATSHKPQATSHKPQAFKLGFTLSELLVSLAVLGLIAGLTVPSIVVAVNTAKTKAMQKEGVQIIREIIQAGMLNGDFSGISNWSIGSTTDPIVAYFTSKLNATNCPAGVETFPCNHRGSAVLDQQFNHSARWVLPNGLKIWFNGWVHNPYTANTSMMIGIDSKPDGPDSSQVVGGDRLYITCNITDIRQAVPGSDGILAPGACGPGGSGYAAQYNAIFF